MAFLNYPRNIEDPYDLVVYELGGFEPCNRCGNEHPIIVTGEEGGVGIYCTKCGHAVADFVKTRKVIGEVPPVKHGDLEFGVIRAARLWNNAMHWFQDGEPNNDEAYALSDGKKREGGAR